MELTFQVTSFIPRRTYIAIRAWHIACSRFLQPCQRRRVCGHEGGVALLDRLDPSHVENSMKAQIDMSLWSIIERLQRRLERQGMAPATADRAVAIAIRQLATAR